MKKYLFLLIVPALLSAQFQFIPLSADYATFTSNDSLSFVQIYTGIFQGSLQYTKNDDGTFSSSFTNVLEIRKDTTLIDQIAHKYSNTAKDSTEMFAYNQFVDVFNLEIPYGSYKVKIQVTDNNSQKSGEYLLDIKTLEPNSKLHFSDVQLCSEIKQDTTQNMFYKNGLRVVPNPRAVYDVINPLLYFYLEIDNLSHSQESNNNYIFDYCITNADGDTIRSKRSKTKDIIGSRVVEVGGMNVIALPKGIYFFNVDVKDIASNQTTSTRKKFIINKPSKQEETKPVAQNNISDFYIGFTEQQLDEEFKMTSYMSTSEEKSVYKNLAGKEAKQRFLTQFWMRQDNNNRLAPGTFRNIYLKRIEIANQKYNAMGRAGWKSDMGRVFILYGEPDEYERHPSSIDAIPYVIWHYHSLEGGAKFVFADEEGFGTFRLIHSTYRKELQNPNWEDIINKSSSSSSSDFGF